MSKHTPDHRSRPHRRLKGNLAAAAAFVNGNILWAIVPVAGCSSLRVRIKATNTGTLDGIFLGPDFDVDQALSTAFGSLVGDQYTTNNPTQLAVVANTEASKDIACAGESHLLLKFTGTATGAITFVDVCHLSSLR